MKFSIERKCIICGETFIAKHNRRMICYRDHYRTCEICGKEFVCNKSYTSDSIKTCSEKCRRAAISKNSTNGQKKYPHVCRVCGKTYYSSIQDGSRDYGICDNPHTKICVICGKEFQVMNKYLYDRRQTCSEDCRYLLASQTWHGNEEINMQNLRDTMQEKYGVDYSWQIPSVMLKSQQTCMKRYGETSYSKTQEFKDRLIKQNQEKYGTDWYIQTPEYWEQARSTWMKNYGVDNPSKAGQVIAGFVNDPDKIDTLMEFRTDPKKFVESRYGDNLPTLKELASVCGIRESSIGWILQQTGNQDLAAYVYSYTEKEVYEFLESLQLEVRVERNTRQVITPYELDLYIPEYQIGIECNPTGTHNSTHVVWADDNSATPKDYHKMKTDLCEQKGIFLFHIFGYEWTHRQEIIKSMLANLFGKTERRIFARKTEIREVSFKDSAQFLEMNHRQGRAIAKYRYGLYYDDELVSLMTFSKMRNTIGTGTEDLSDCYELVRFCNKLNTSVVGGAGKLFHHFIQVIQPSRIRSFSDRSHTRGGLYQTLGFKSLRYSDPNYVWVNKKTDIAVSRLNAQKQNIREFLKDATIDLSKTEVEIMSEHGYVQVFDSGTILWEWRRNID